MLNEIDGEIVLRRLARFFEAGGICERYEFLGDHLMAFGEIAKTLPDLVPGLSAEALIRRFVFSARNGGFGWHGSRRTIERLLDLANVRTPRGLYSLRPSSLRVQAAPQIMFARRSIWAQWLQAQGWPVPGELRTSILIDAEPVERLLPARRGGRPAKVREPVSEWFNKLSVEDIALSDSKLADIFIAEGGKGDQGSIRKTIGRLRKKPD